MSTKAAARSRQERAEEVIGHGRRNARIRNAAVWTALVLVLGGILTAMFLTSRPESSGAVRAAPGFTLPRTDGTSVTLSDYRGKNVLLYFSEGAGCQSCLVQMAEIEKHAADFDGLGVTVLPIVMNSRADIMKDMEANGVKTPFLLDDGSVSKAYGTLGKGMHGGLPGHSFVLVDKDGRQRWYGEYPSMWLDPGDLVKEVRQRLG